MNPFAAPRSLAGSTCTASASMATSCVAEHTLWINRMPVNKPIACEKSIGSATSSVSIIPSCAPTIQVRRRPKRTDVIVSTIGPNAHLNAHGRYNEPT